MNRRNLLKSAALFSAAAVLPSKSILAKSPQTDAVKSAAFRRFKLGELELTVVSDGGITLSPVQPFFAPDADPKEVERLLRESFRPVNGVNLGVNILVVRSKDKLILLDTGTGPVPDNSTGWLMNSLAGAGIKPANITDIIISHAHNDHIGGLVDVNGNIAFTNAVIHLPKIEKDFWTSANPDFSKSKIDTKMVSPMVDAIRKTLKVTEAKTRLYLPGETLFGFIKLQLAAGHTPGHTLVNVFSGTEELLFIADLIHSDVLLFPHPEWGFFGDTDFAQAAATRRSILAQLAQSRKRVLAYHLPWPGLGNVRVKGDGFEWIAETFSTPEYQ